MRSLRSSTGSSTRTRSKRISRLKQCLGLKLRHYLDLRGAGLILASKRALPEV